MTVYCYVYYNAVPSVSVNVQPLAGVIVWGPPAEPNGVILGYNVSFYDSSSKPKRIIPKGPSDSYHLVTNSDIAGLDSSNTFVQVMLLIALFSRISIVTDMS